MLKEAYQQLRQKGYRMTRQRRFVLDTLTHFPQNVTKIHAQLIKKNIRINKVTIYRILDLFILLGLVSKTQFKGKTTQYELHSQSHHHHLVCNQCDRVEDILFKEEFLLKEARKYTTFRIDTHHLEFFGLCANCQ